MKEWSTIVYSRSNAHASQEIKELISWFSPMHTRFLSLFKSTVEKSRVLMLVLMKLHQAFLARDEVGHLRLAAIDQAGLFISHN